MSEVLRAGDPDSILEFEMSSILISDHQDQLGSEANLEERGGYWFADSMEALLEKRGDGRYRADAWRTEGPGPRSGGHSDQTNPVSS